MTRHPYFITRDSDCERFLAAPLWDEPVGGPLSVMSAFARLGLEPWAEANRLQNLPHRGAESALALSLSRLPLIGMELPDYAAISARLIDLLPERRSSAISLPSNKPSDIRGWLFLIVAAALLLFLQTHGYLF